MSSLGVRTNIVGTVAVCPLLHHIANSFQAVTSTCWSPLSSCPCSKALGRGGRGRGLLRKRVCLGREADGPFLILSRHPGNYCCRSGCGGHQRAFLWSVPGHEQERTAVRFGESHHQWLGADGIATWLEHLVGRQRIKVVERLAPGHARLKLV